MPRAFFNSEVIDIVDETPIVKRYFFRADPKQEFRFKAGQFVMLDLPIQSKISTRSYSIASAPRNDNIFELCIVLKEDGLGTPYLFENIKVGDHVKTTGPLGKFLLPDTLEHDLCFICTGTGIAPFRSQLIDLFNHQVTHQNIYLIFGNRKQEDILYRNEMEALAQQQDKFHFIPVLSRETPDTWTGVHGYVHSVYESLFEDRRQAHFYICGWSNMVREARDRLIANGYDRKQLKFELYD